MYIFIYLYIFQKGFHEGKNLFLVLAPMDTQDRYAAECVTVTQASGHTLL